MHKRTHQYLLEELFYRNQIKTKLRSVFSDTSKVDLLTVPVSSGLPEKFVLDFLSQIALHKRADLPTMVGLLKGHFDSMQECADAIYKAVELGLCWFYTDIDKFVVKYELSDEVWEKLERYQFPLPMVVKPEPLQDNTDIGFLTYSGSVILKDNHHNKDVYLSHLDRTNSVPLRINEKVLEHVFKKWQGDRTRKSNESRQEYQMRLKQFDKFKRNAIGIMELLNKHSDEFFLTHRYDKRGRTYAVGYHVNYQGQDYNKAVIEFAVKEYINE